MEKIPQSAACRVPLKAYLTSDHVSPATGKTIAIVISKNGAAFGNPSAGATNATEIANGWYYVDLTTTDTGTLGPLIVRGTSTGVDDVEPEPFDVGNPHNAGFDGIPNATAGASGGLPLSVDASGRVDVLKINGTSQTARDIGASVLLSAGTGAGQLDFTSGVVKANLAQILGTALTETAGQIAGAFKKLFDVAAPTLTCLNINQTGDSYARLGAPTGASISADIAGIVAGVWGAGARTLTGFGSVVADTATAVWGAGARALTAFGFTVSATADPNVALIKAKTDNLPAAPAAVSDIPTANANADALLDRADAIETGWTIRKALRIIAAACAGKLSGAATPTATIRNITDTKARITATVDADGNRTAVTLDGA